MSSEKNPEVVGCDASIMKNVWEIRVREYDLKMQMERDRIEKSALPAINQDWAGRLAARVGGYKRVEAKPRKRVEIQNDNNVWKSKEPLIPTAPPRGLGSGPLGKPGGQSRGFSTPTASSKDKMAQDKNFNRLQLLKFLSRSQPSAMVWGKSWKYNKCLPSPAEGSTASWGQCWMFATLQPFSEAGKPWPNGPNKMDPHSLHLWRKSDYRMVESQELDLSLHPEEWQMSWKKYDKCKKEAGSSVNDKNVPKYGFFTLLMETQHHNEVLCSSEWSESWRATKPAGQQDGFTVPNEGLMNESIVHRQDEEREMNSEWEECWRFVNHQGGNKAKSQLKNSAGREWANSWRAAIVGFSNQQNSDASLRQDHSNTYDDRSQQKESCFHKIMPLSCEPKYKALYLQLCNESEVLSEWSKSWQLTKNNSKPSETIEKVLKESPPSLETDLQTKRMEKNFNMNSSTSEKADPHYEQLKHYVFYQPKREFTQSKLFLLKCLEKMRPSSEWRDSWKMIKHRMRLERRRMRPNRLRPFRESENGGDMKPTASEWKDSWRTPRQSLNQEPDLWQHGWPSTAQIRVNRATNPNHFAPVERPKNGPAGEPGWTESWRFSRQQLRSQPVQGRAQISQGRSDRVSHLSDNSWSQMGHIRSTSDWQPAWMVSETQFHHDNPSLTQWREAWKCSINQTQHWPKQEAQKNWVDEIMEIQPLKEKISLQRAKAKMSQSFDNQMFRQRYPEKKWSPSWSAVSLLTHQQSNCRSLGTIGQNISSNIQLQHASTTDNGFKWGRSFRLANPMPHLEQHWVESYPNSRHYSVMWSRGKKIKINIPANFTNNPATFRVWVNSHRFLYGASAQIDEKSKSKKPTDSRVIIAKKAKTKRHLYSTFDNEKQSERKWAGCHLLAKTQPRPKRSPGSQKKLKPEAETEDRFFEEWAESWKFVVSPSSLKKQKPVKSLTGWNESWKFLLLQSQPVTGPKAG